MEQENIKLEAIIEAIKFARKMEIESLTFSSKFTKSLFLTKDDSKKLQKICKKYTASICIKEYDSLEKNLLSIYRLTEAANNKRFELIIDIEY